MNELREYNKIFLKEKNDRLNKEYEINKADNIEYQKK